MGDEDLLASLWRRIATASGRSIRIDLDPEQQRMLLALRKRSSDADFAERAASNYYGLWVFVEKLRREFRASGDTLDARLRALARGLGLEYPQPTRDRDLEICDNYQSLLAGVDQIVLGHGAAPGIGSAGFADKARDMRSRLPHRFGDLTDEKIAEVATRMIRGGAKTPAAACRRLAEHYGLSYGRIRTILAEQNKAREKESRLPLPPQEEFGACEKYEQNQ